MQAAVYAPLALNVDDERKLRRFRKAHQTCTGALVITLYEKGGTALTSILCNDCGKEAIL